MITLFTIPSMMFLAKCAELTENKNIDLNKNNLFLRIKKKTTALAASSQCFRRSGDQPSSSLHQQFSENRNQLSSKNEKPELLSNASPQPAAPGTENIKTATDSVGTEENTITPECYAKSRADISRCRANFFKNRVTNAEPNLKTLREQEQLDRLVDISIQRRGAEPQDRGYGRPLIFMLYHIDRYSRRRG